MMKKLYDRVALIGLGLIASSMGHAMRRADGIVGEIVGYDRTTRTRELALELNFCDRVTETASAAVADADLVVLCVPVGVMGVLAAEISSHLKPRAILSDVGSVKVAVIKAILQSVPAGVDFIAAHPLAGTEYSGPKAGFAELFDGRWCILTPQTSNIVAVERLQLFWNKLGAEVTLMTAEHHDLVLAVTSHVPHLIAYTMVGVADDLQRITDKEVINFSAAGFRDFTRIAASDPTMWRDIFLNNKQATLKILERFSENLLSLQRAICRDDSTYLYNYFMYTRTVRRGIIDAGQDTKKPDFGRTRTKN